MKSDLKAPSKSVDLRDACKTVKLTADTQEEAEMLAVLARWCLHGGRVTIETRDRSTRLYRGHWPIVTTGGGS